MTTYIGIVAFIPSKLTKLLRQRCAILIFVVSLSWLSLGKVNLGWSEERQNLPNILLIVADDLGWSDVGWHGGFAKTPVLDRLVRAGVELNQHYVQPVCTPTRTALMSGRYPGRFGPQALSPSNL